MSIPNGKLGRRACGAQHLDTRRRKKEGGKIRVENKGEEAREGVHTLWGTTGRKTCVAQHLGACGASRRKRKRR